MDIKNNLTNILVSGIVLTNSSITEAKDNVKKSVYQLVESKLVLIPTDDKIIRNYKTDSCFIYNGHKIYFSKEKHIIPTSFFFDVSKNDINKIKESKKC
ncbi:hypothetical protein H3C61_04415 [Candidatus Gracilibacteria bacterium]|nr:hypothetical protein [Candidatus Gracilibacteria bacterium]